MSERLVFGRDRMPEPEGAPKVPECKPGNHLMDDSMARCTECLWLNPAVRRCETQGCDWPGEYEVEVGPKDEGPEFTTILQAAVFCGAHALMGGIALVPGKDQA